MSTIDLPTLVQKIRVDSSDMVAAEKRAAAMSKGMQDAQGNTEKAGADLEAQNAKTAKSTEKLGDSSKRASKDVDHLGGSAGNAEKEVGKLADQVRRTRTETDRTSRSTERASRKIDGLGDAAERAGKKFKGGGLSKFLRPAMYLGIASAISPAITAIGALGGAGVALAGGLAPAAGAAAALPGLLLAVVGGVTAFKSATKGTGKAADAIVEFGEGSKEAKKALAALTPEARTFVKALVPVKKILKATSDDVKRFALPGLAAGLKAGTPALKIFRTAAGDVGKIIGATGRELGKFVGSKGFLTDLRTLGKSNTSVFKTLAGGLKPLISLIRTIAVAAAPMTRALAGAATQFLRFLDSTAGKNRGKLTDFFNRAGRAAINLGKGVGKGIAGISRIAGIGANVFGGSDGITTWIDKTLTKFNDWTKSVGGKNAIKQYFEDIKPAAKELGKLAVDVVKGLFKLSRDPNTADMIKKIRTDLLPAIITLVEKAGTMAPALVDALTSIAKIVDTIDPTTFQAIAAALGATANAMALIAKWVPGFGTFVGLMLTYAAIRRLPVLGKTLPSIPNLATGGRIGTGSSLSKKGGKGGGGLGGGGGIVPVGGKAGKAGKITATPGTITTRAEAKAVQALATKNAGKLAKLRNIKGAGALGLLAAFIDPDELLGQVTNGKYVPPGMQTGPTPSKPGAGVLRPGKTGGVQSPANFRAGAGTGGQTMSKEEIRKAIDAQPLAQAGVGGGGINFDAIKTKATEAMSGLRGILSKGFTDAQSTSTTGSTGVTGAISGVLGRIPGIGGLNMSGLIGRFTTGFSGARGTATTGSTGITGTIGGILSRIPGIGSVNMGGLVGRLTSGFSTAQGTASTGSSGIVGRISGILGRIPGIAGRAIGGAVSHFGGFVGRAVGALGDGSSLYAAGGQLVGRLAAGIRDAAGQVRSAISHVASIIAAHVPGSPVKTGPLTKFNNGGVGLRLTEMLAGGIKAGTGSVAAAALGMASAAALSPSISPAVSAAGASIPTAFSGRLAGVPAASAPVGGAVDRSITVNIGTINSGRDEPASDSLTRKLGVLQAGGVFG